MDNEFARQVAEYVADILTNKPPVPRMWLSHKDAAKHLGVSPRTIDAFCAAKKIKYRFVGSHRRYNVKDLDAVVSDEPFTDGLSRSRAARVQS